MIVNIDDDGDSHEDADDYDSEESACIAGVGDVVVVLLHLLARWPDASCFGQTWLVPVLLVCRGEDCSGQAQLVRHLLKSHTCRHFHFSTFTTQPIPILNKKFQNLKCLWYLMFF